MRVESVSELAENGGPRPKSSRTNKSRSMLCRAGRLCSRTDPSFGVAKVLAIDGGAVHVRLYKNRFPSRPKEVDPSTLSLGSIDEAGGGGIGHLPLSPEGFAAWRPVFIMQSSVSEEELEGYKLWKESGGGVWQ